MSRDGQDDLRALLAEAHAFVAWEQELGGIGLAPRAGRSRITAPTDDADAPTAVPVRPTPAVALAPRPSIDEARRRLALLAEEAAGCTACRLHQTRTRSVFARGSATADLAFVGEGPGFNEDQEGLPFVGPAGQLLDKMIVAMGYQPESVYVCNVVKCRPPENRTPEPDEATACGPFLAAQLEIVRPRVIVALGRCAAEGLGAMPAAGRGWRGQWSSWNGIEVMPTYHPAYLLRSPDQKRVVWDDLQKVMAVLGGRGRP